MKFLDEEFETNSLERWKETLRIVSDDLYDSLITLVFTVKEKAYVYQ